MAFYGCEFVFDDVSCKEYELMLYDIGTVEEDGVLSTQIEIVEDRTSFRHSPLHYGVIQNEPLTFTLTFGVDVNRVENNEPLTRHEMNSIANWLTGHDQYKYLEIIQSDILSTRFKCIITELNYVSYGKIPWAIKCKVVCDSPFGYLYPEVFSFDNSDTQPLLIDNIGATKYYFPKIVITVNGGDSVSIVNESDNSRAMTFTGLTSGMVITIDNENEIITNSEATNAYENFNFQFFRLIKGQNEITINGDVSVEFYCAFPVYIGS